MEFTWLNYYKFVVNLKCNFAVIIHYVIIMEM